MRVVLGGLGLVIFGSACALAYWLLMQGKFSGAEFASFVIAFGVLSLVVAYAPEVQEISIAGNVVKLKEVKAEALAAIESLNQSRVEMLSIFLSLALKHAGGFGSGAIIDPRNTHFWKLIELSRKYKCLDQLRTQVGISLHVLMISQIRQLQARNDQVRGLDSLPLPTVFELTDKMLSGDGVRQVAERQVGKDLKSEIAEGIEEYQRLDQLRQELKLSRITMQSEA
jgi:hypothetical protein